jgi:hypothetical protein
VRWSRLLLEFLTGVLVSRPDFTRFLDEGIDLELTGLFPWRFATAKWPELAVATDTDLCPREEMEPSAAYREFYLPMDAVHGLGGTMLVTPAAQSLIIAVRGAKAGPFGEAE